MGFLGALSAVITALANQPTKANPKGSSIWDTDMAKEYAYLDDGTELSEEREEEINQILACPSALIHTFDRNLEAYLFRLSIWGKITFRHVDPDRHINKEFKDKQTFFNIIDDKNRKRQYGLWDTYEEMVNKVKFYREFKGSKGQTVKEEVYVIIDLRPDLKRALKHIRKDKGLTG